MAVDTPVLERSTNVKNSERYAVPTRRDYMAEDEHNARIRDTYARLINPNNKIEDVFAANKAAEREVASAEPIVQRPYLVENARADAAIFRADSAINNKAVEDFAEVEVDQIVDYEEEDEDLRPTPTTIQYQTIGKKQQTAVSSTTDKRLFSLGKKEKIIIAVFVAFVAALVTLLIVNSAVISRLNADIAAVQNSITTVRGALAGVNAEMKEIIYTGLGY